MRLLCQIHGHAFFRHHQASNHKPTMKHILLPLLFLAICTSTARAQDTFDEFRKGVEQRFRAHRQQVEGEFDAYRRQVNERFAGFMRKAWANFTPRPEVPEPKDEQPVPPIEFRGEKDGKPIEGKLQPIKDLVPPPLPEPQPQPIVPIEEKEQQDNILRLAFLGNTLQVRVPRDHCFTLRNVRENTIADAWQCLSGGIFDNTLRDLLEIRKNHQLCDWAYLQLLKAFACDLLGEKNNEATLLTAWFYTQSGYMMRLARNGERLSMLYGSRFTLFGRPYYVLDGQNYYELEESDEEELSICDISFPKERALSLCITQEPVVPQAAACARTLQARDFPAMRFTVHTNKHLIDFYNTYPTGRFGANECTRWAVYANTPLNTHTRSELYPALRKTLEGKTQAEALTMLLNFVQTALVYEYDDKVWGGDRAFFPEETLHYPYADCEDRAILFTRLVRDLLQLRAALVYYPGHLAAAIKVTDPAIKGDVLLINEERYLVCDPTFINAPIGRTMPGMDNARAQAICLE